MLQLFLLYVVFRFGQICYRYVYSCLLYSLVSDLTDLWNIVEENVKRLEEKQRCQLDWARTLYWQFRKREKYGSQLMTIRIKRGKIASLYIC